MRKPRDEVAVSEESNCLHRKCDCFQLLFKLSPRMLRQVSSGRCLCLLCRSCSSWRRNVNVPILEARRLRFLTVGGPLGHWAGHRAHWRFSFQLLICPYMGILGSAHFPQMYRFDDVLKALHRWQQPESPVCWWPGQGCNVTVHIPRWSPLNPHLTFWATQQPRYYSDGTTANHTAATTARGVNLDCIYCLPTPVDMYVLFVLKC